MRTDRTSYRHKRHAERRSMSCERGAARIFQCGFVSARRARIKPARQAAKRRYRTKCRSQTLADPRGHVPCDDGGKADEHGKGVMIDVAALELDDAPGHIDDAGGTTPSGPSRSMMAPSPPFQNKRPSQKGRRARKSGHRVRRKYHL